MFTVSTNVKPLDKGSAFARGHHYFIIKEQGDGIKKPNGAYETPGRIDFLIRKC